MENFVSRETLTAAKMNKLVGELNGKQDKISDLATIRSNASAGKSANDSLGSKQDTISDLSSIRSGASLGATALQPSALTPYRTSASQDEIDNTKVDKVEGKGLSANDFTNADKSKLANLENYDDNCQIEMETSVQPWLYK